MFTSRSAYFPTTPRRAASAAAFALAALLSGCGGSGGSGGHPAPPPPSPPPPPPVELGPLYDFTPIGLPGITYGDIDRRGIATSARVTGTSRDAAGNVRAFYYNGKENIDLGTFGGRHAQAFSINRCGQISGWAHGTGDLARAFYYDGALRDLGTLGGAESFGFAVSTCGKVAGWSATSGGETHAFYHDGKTMRDLGTFGGSGSYALAINSVGQVAGYAYGPGNAWFHAFLFDARTGAPIQDLGALGDSSLAQDINDAGQVVGYSRAADGALRAFRYEAGTMHDLGLLPGARGAEARAINGAGLTVGYVYYPDGRQVAFVHDGTTMHDLGTLGGSRFSDAVAINSTGLVVGSSIDAAAGAQRATAWNSNYGPVDLNKRVRNLPKDVELVGALAVADDGGIAVRTNKGLGLLRPVR
jgi:probable HAF family extracellular repeat protein